MKNDPLPPKLAFACPKRWEDMRVDGPQQRFCDQCQLHVCDLSAMTKREGKRILTEANERLCVSYLVRPDGTMVTRTRWDGLKRGWLSVRQATLTLLAMVLPFAFVSCMGNHRDQASRLGGTPCMSSPDGKDSDHLVLGRVRTTRTTGEAPPAGWQDTTKTEPPPR